jgi:hypothetical protein
MNYIKSLSSLKAFIPDKKYIIDIIKICRLKHTNDWKIWQDDYGNILSVNLKKEPSIILNQNIDLQKIQSKDLYFKAHINKLSSINKYSLIAIHEDIYYIWMLDYNNILRLCMYVNDILVENQPILNSGIKNLRKIIETLDVDGYKFVHSIIEPISGIKIDQSYATSWPMTNDLLNLLPEIIKKDCNFVQR